MKKYNLRIKRIIIVILLSILLLGIPLRKTKNIDKVTYNTFMSMIDNKKVGSVTIKKDNVTLEFIDKSNVKYVTDNPRSVDFRKILLEKDIRVIEEKPFDFIGLISKLLTIILAISLIQFLLKNKSKISDIHKIGKPADIPESQVVKFSDVAGHNEVKKDLQLIVEFLKNPNKFKEMGADMPKGVILAGDPGTGKTLLAKAVAGEAGVPFYSISGSEFIELYVGVGASRVRSLFAEARKNAPSIIFIDEIDSIGKKREQDSNSERDQTINQLLKEMDGFDGSEGVLVISATNRIEILDDALIRPGRFDKHITVPKPQTSEERLEIINLYIKNKRFSDDVSFEALAKETIGFSGADIKTLINEATIISIMNNKSYIDKECIDKAIYQKLLNGHAKENMKRSKEDIKLIAWHEAGHALTAKLLTDMEVPRITITPSTSGVGGGTFLIPKKMGLYSIEDLKNKVRVNYGGNVAEYLLLGDKNKVTTGAYQDIKSATNLIVSMIKYYGMCDDIGMLNLDDLNVGSKIVFNEAKKLSNHLYEETKTLLSDNKELLELIATALIKEETISGDRLNEIINNYIPYYIGI